MLQLILDKLSLHLQKRSNNNEETWEGKIKLKDRFRVYRLYIRQPSVKENLRLCGNGKFWIFPWLQMSSKI